MSTSKERINYQKSGYLHSDYRLFHLKDTALRTFDFHYHDFHKILIFLGGNVSYIVEGRQYDLRPYDMLLIPAGEIHKPIVHGQTSYERIILYLSPSFFEKNNSEGTNLFYCFESAMQSASNLVRLKNKKSSSLPEVIRNLVINSHSLNQENAQFGADLYQKIKVMEYLILLNRTMLTKQFDFSLSVTGHPTVLSIMEYINNHISEDLSIDRIADNMFLNRSYIMHLFKSETGYTIGQYITKKRLFLTTQYRAQGLSVTEACYKSGFRNYSAYYHASRQE